MKEFSLVGIDGNAWAIMAYVNKAMRKCGIQPRERNAYMSDARSGDYDHLLSVSSDMIDKLNREYVNS